MYSNYTTKETIESLLIMYADLMQVNVKESILLYCVICFRCAVIVATWYRTLNCISLWMISNSSLEIGRGWLLIAVDMLLFRSS